MATRACAAGHDLWVTECGQCGVVFAVLSSFDDLKRQDHSRFYCPNGHPRVYREGESHTDRQLRLANARADQAEAEAKRQRDLRAWAETRTKGANIAAGKAKAETRRLKTRIAHGVCPCCHRTFKQLAAHMTTKHPEFKAGAADD